MKHKLIINRCICALLSLLLIFISFINHKAPIIDAIETDDAPLFIRDYTEFEEENRFQIGAFSGPDLTDDNMISLLLDAEIDFTDMGMNDLSTNMASIITVFQKLQDAGIKLYLTSNQSTIPSATGSMIGATQDGKPDYAGIYPVQSQYGDWYDIQHGYNMVEGTFMWDEPLSTAEIDIIKTFYPTYEEKFPNKTFFVNLIPADGISSSLSHTTTTDFINYVEHYATQVLDNLSGRKVLSTDPYPFQRNNNDTVSSYFINQNYLFNLATMAMVAKEHDADLSLFVQMMDCSQENHKTKNSRDVKAQADVDMEYNMAMAFGAKQVINFCYETPIMPSGQAFESEAMITANGETTNRYNWVKNTSKRIHGFDNVYMQFDYNGTVISKGTTYDMYSGSNNKCGTSKRDCYWAFSDNTFKNITPFASDFNATESIRSSLCKNNLLSVSSTETSFVGLFEDDLGYNGYMVVNGNDYRRENTDTVTLKFDSSVKKVRVFDGSTYEDISLDSNNTLKLSLSCGGSKFVVPFKEGHSITYNNQDKVDYVEVGGDYMLNYTPLNDDEVFVGWLYENNLYHNGQTLKNISNNIVVEPLFIDFKMEKGASIRIDNDDEHALRFTALLKKSDYDLLNNYVLNAQYGIYIMCDFKIGSLNIEFPFEKFSNYNDYYKLRGVMTNIGDIDLTTDFEGRAYINVTYSDNYSQKIYAIKNDNIRSVSYIAYMAYIDESNIYSEDELARLRVLASYYQENVVSLEEWLNSIK